MAKLKDVASKFQGKGIGTKPKKLGNTLLRWKAMKKGKNQMEGNPNIDGQSKWKKKTYKVHKD